jgi:hypothetical protein
MATPEIGWAPSTTNKAVDRAADALAGRRISRGLGARDGPEVRNTEDSAARSSDGRIQDSRLSRSTRERTALEGRAAMSRPTTGRGPEHEQVGGPGFDPYHERPGG